MAYHEDRDSFGENATNNAASDGLDDIIRPSQLKAKTGLSRATVYRMMDRGEFPKPIVLSAGAVGWPESVIKAWRNERAKASADGEIKASGKREPKPR